MSFVYRGYILWNELPKRIKQKRDFKNFKNMVKSNFSRAEQCITTYICLYYYSWQRLLEILPPKSYLI